MKKLLLIVWCCFLCSAIFSQVKMANPIDKAAYSSAVAEGTISNIPDCFCCSDSIYSLPKPPVINGPAAPVCACDAIRLSTIKCSGANITWTATDDKGNSISFAGAGTNAITLNYSLAMQVASHATSITVSVVIRCGNKEVRNSIRVILKPVPRTNVSFSLTDDGNGNYTATATGVTGFGTGWTLKEVNCPGPNPCSWVPGGIKWQSTGSTITIPNNVLIKGKCYVLTHYVNVCSPVWIAGPCTVFNVTCFTLNSSAMMKKLTPKDSDVNDAKEIIPEMLKELQGLKN